MIGLITAGVLLYGVAIWISGARMTDALGNTQSPMKAPIAWLLTLTLQAGLLAYIFLVDHEQTARWFAGL